MCDSLSRLMSASSDVFATNMLVCAHRLESAHIRATSGALRKVTHNAAPFVYPMRIATNDLDAYIQWIGMSGSFVSCRSLLSKTRIYMA